MRTSYWLVTALLLASTAQAQTRKKQVAELHWADATVTVIAASDTNVHLEVRNATWAAAPRERVDYLERWLDSTATVVAATPVLGPGEYVELTSDQGPSSVTRRAYADSSRFRVQFHGPGGGISVAPSLEELAQLFTAMRTAEATTREMSGVGPSRDRRGK